MSIFISTFQYLLELMYLLLAISAVLHISRARAFALFLCRANCPVNRRTEAMLIKGFAIAVRLKKTMQV